MAGCDGARYDGPADGLVPEEARLPAARSAVEAQGWPSFGSGLGAVGPVASPLSESGAVRDCGPAVWLNGLRPISVQRKKKGGEKREKRKMWAVPTALGCIDSAQDFFFSYSVLAFSYAVLE